MTATTSAKKSVLSYSQPTISRAERALCCSPFNISVFMRMRNESVPIQAIANLNGYQEGYTKRPLTESKVERELMWLIKVGLLRREVDGQGITDSFRLTPLGKQIVEKWESASKSFPTLSWWEKLKNLIQRCLSGSF